MLTGATGARTGNLAAGAGALRGRDGVEGNPDTLEAAEPGVDPPTVLSQYWSVGYTGGSGARRRPTHCTVPVLVGRLVGLFGWQP